MTKIIWDKAKLFLYGILTFNIVWFLSAVLLNKRILPRPRIIYLELPSMISIIGPHIYASLNRVFMGIGISFIIGIFLGTLMGYSDKIDSILRPFLYFAYPIPKLALLPIIMLIMGLGEGSKITMIVVIVVFQVIVAIRDAIRAIPSESYAILTSLGANKLQVLFHITAPAILAETFTSIRLALGTAISVLFFTETYGTETGMGYFIMDAWMRIDYKQMYGGILILSFIGFFLFVMIDIMNEYVWRWKS